MAQFRRNPARLGRVRHDCLSRAAGHTNFPSQMRAANGGIAGFTAGSGAAQWNCAIVTRTRCQCLSWAGPGANTAFVMPELGRTSYQCCI